MAKKKVSTKKTKTVNNKTEEYAVMYLHNVMKMSSKDIAKELEVDLTNVESVINAASETTSNKKRKSKSHDLMIRKTSAKGTNNVSIMTEAASQYNDELKKNQTHNKKTSKLRDCIRIIEK